MTNNLSAYPADDHLPGSIIDSKLQVLARLSHSARCSVYSARNLSLDKLVAVKVLNAEHCTDTEQLARFQREAQAISSLRSNHVVAIYDLGRLSDGRPYQLMEFARGQSLAVGATTSQYWHRLQLLDVFMQICSALLAVHNRGIVHRNVSPSNIIVYEDPASGVLTAKLLGFGQARLMSTEREIVHATGYGAPYTSPEQCRGLRADARSDIYCLGLVMYELLTGQKAVSARSADEYVLRHTYDMPRPFEETQGGRDVPKLLQQVVLGCLAKDPATRYGSVDELNSALARAVMVLLGATKQPTGASQQQVSVFLSRLAANAITRLPEGVPAAN